MGYKQQGKFVALPQGFEASVVPKVESYETLEFNGVYITWDRTTAYLRYAGVNAEKSYTTFELPLDCESLRNLANALLDLAVERGKK